MTAVSAVLPADAGHTRTMRSRSRDYSVCGGVLRSALEFPELPETVADEADWVL